MINSFQPVIKWSGSKRSQVKDILKCVPLFNTYYEPFLGGGSVMYSVNPDSGICGDICKPLIDLWLLIRNNPKYLIDYYTSRWNKLQKDGVEVFLETRKCFNLYYRPEDLFFLSRTCVNGLIRFNQKGEFNNSMHYTRKGINPSRIEKIIYDWSERIQKINFVTGDYKETTQTAQKNDFLYLDPPYFHTKGRYYSNKTINFEEFFLFLDDLNRREIKFALSFDGKRGDENYIIDLPQELYKKRILIKSGLSSFKKVMEKQNTDVFETLYLNFEV